MSAPILSWLFFSLVAYHCIKVEIWVLRRSWLKSGLWISGVVNDKLLCCLVDATLYCTLSSLVLTLILDQYGMRHFHNYVPVPASSICAFSSTSSLNRSLCICVLQNALCLLHLALLSSRQWFYLFIYFFAFALGKRHHKDSWHWNWQLRSIPFIFTT